MARTPWNIEWSDHNLQRNYPLVADASARDTTDSFEIPEDFLSGLDLPLHASMDLDPVGFYIRQLGVFPTGYSILISHDNGSEIVDIASAVVPRASHARHKSYALSGIEPFDDTAGKISVGKLSTIDEQPSGLFEFSLETTRLEPDVVRPIIRGVQSLVVVDGAQRSERLIGDIELLAGENMQITPIVVSGQPSQIQFSAISGEGLTESCVCEDELDSPCVKRINGIAPTAGGDFYFIGDDCTDIAASANGLRITDKCSKPCCGCEELEVITRDLEELQKQRSIFELFLEQLQTSVETMNLVVLGSRLGNTCVTCE